MSESCLREERERADVYQVARTIQLTTTPIWKQLTTVRLKQWTLALVLNTSVRQHLGALAKDELIVTSGVIDHLASPRCRSSLD